MKKEHSVILRHLGIRIRHYRTEMNLTQELLASRVGIDRTYISGIERGIRNPTITMLVRISRAVGVSVSELLDEIR